MEQKKSPRAEQEEALLTFWKERDIFNRSVSKDAPQGDFVFFEGPPTANGMPGIHHLEARAFKDCIPRFKTMRGYRVRRKGGWDTHGLPVELQVEKKLQLTSKKDIEHYGVAAFNTACKESVWEYVDIWNRFTTRIGYWVDQEHPYVTYHTDYIESVWNIIAQIHEKKLLYKDYKIVPWCPRCGTGLSSHELAQGYQEVKELSVYAQFKVRDQENTYVIAWTTTPWTLPGNVALAVGETIPYVKVRSNDRYYILAEARLSVFTEPYEIIETMNGGALCGLSYEPLYPFLQHRVTDEKMYRIYSASFVTDTDGTGIVHTAVMYGADDFELGTILGLPKVHTVDESGHFYPDMDFLSGRFVKDEAVAVDIIKDLAHRGLLFKKEKYEHTYPHCWRCKTPLLYYARDSWYIRMSSVRDSLLKENEKITWEPAHIKDGRFGEWLREVKDWALSRERYWGTPLPIWKRSDGSVKVLGSIEALRAHVKKSGNTYFVMRHGHSEGNIHEVVSSRVENHDPLTSEGIAHVQAAAATLEPVDVIITSPFMRTKQTAELMAEAYGVSPDHIIVDTRLSEIDAGDFEGTSWHDFHTYIASQKDWFTHAVPGGESFLSIQRRVGELLYELEKTYSGKRILLVTHGGPAWLTYVVAGYARPEGKSYTYAQSSIFTSDFKRFANAEIRPLPFVPLPHDTNYTVDVHRPYIDELEYIDDDGEILTRVPEVLDVWFDSGAMPLAQHHYPFENVAWVDGPGGVADFISEAIDQTRGWFYTLLAIGVLTGRGTPYKNVICLGHILDAQGKKMSKSLGNIVDPWIMMDRYGVDALRLWMYSVNQPGDSKNFDEKTVDELVKKVFNLISNVASFYELYKEGVHAENPYTSPYVLDQWILSKTDRLLLIGTTALDQYDIFTAARLIREYVDDLSTWYIRRSRDRFKYEGGEDAAYARATTRYVLKTLAAYMAPFTPFFAETLYKQMGGEHESVHLAPWPELHPVNETVLADMEVVRTIVSKGLEQRQRAGIKVRQPLASITISESVDERYQDIIKDELNVKEVQVGTTMLLDTTITDALRREGNARDLIRAIQEIRKEAGYAPHDLITLVLSPNAETLIAEYMPLVQSITGAHAVVYEAQPGTTLTFDDIVITFSVRT